MINLNSPEYNLGFQLTTEKILQLVSDYDIFRYYFSEYIPGSGSVCSPLRQESSPSFSIFYSNYNKWMFYDFRTAESGDCFVFVSKLLRLDYYNTLKRIYSDFNLGNTDHFVIKKSDRISSIEIPLYNKINRDTKIGVKFKEFTTSELLWWKQFNINRDLLKLFNIFSCSHIFINDKIITCKSPTYSFIEKMEDFSYKVYSPFETKYKWITNHRSNCIQCFSQLPESADLLFISKSTKDCATLRSIGYYAIAPQSESSFIKNKVLDSLKTRFKQIILWYDNDLAGQEMSNKFSKQSGLREISIPQGLPKDPSDFCKNFGEKELENLIIRLL